MNIQLYNAGWFEAMDSIMSFINSLDTEGMTTNEVRSAIYRKAMESPPK